MKKIVKKYGNSFIIRLNKEDMQILGIEIGDVVEISDIVVIKKKKAK